MPTKWLQERPNGSKNDLGIPPLRAFCGARERVARFLSGRVRTAPRSFWGAPFQGQTRQHSLCWGWRERWGRKVDRQRIGCSRNNITHRCYVFPRLTCIGLLGSYGVVRGTTAELIPPLISGRSPQMGPPLGTTTCFTSHRMH